jgi:AraC family transcriptional regulator
MRSTSRVSHRKIARVLDYLRDLAPNATTAEASLDRLAEHAELSKYHFVRQFQRSVGMTPGAYLRTMRLCHAAQLLRRRSDPIVDIAMAVGFADHPSFSRAFARHMGMTPSQYRALGPL